MVEFERNLTSPQEFSAAMLRRTIVAFLFLLSPLVAQPDTEEIDAVFAHWEDGPGGAVGIVLDDRLVFAKGYGYADLARKLPNTPQTVFDLASVSKQFTAASVLLLAQDGALALDDPLGEHLSDLPDYASEITLRMLLGMTSGLPDYDYEGSIELPSLAEQLHEDEPSFEPGAEFEYLNMNYALLTYVVESVSGTGLGDFLKSRISKPLGMEQTVFLSTSGQSIPNRAVGYAEENGTWKVSKNDAPGVGDGNLFSSVDDLSLWARDLLKGSSLLDRQLLTMAWTEGRTSMGRPTGYGLGFEIETEDGLTRVSHTGSWAGTATYISFFPDLGLSVIVLSNREEEACGDLGEQVEELVLDELP